MITKADRLLICLAALLRSSGVGFASAVLAIYLDKKGFGPASIGLIVSAGLAGGAAMTALVSFFGDRWGRRRVLILLAIFGSAGGLGLAFAPSAWLLGALAFLGMVNGMGHDRGGLYTLEQSALSGAGTVRERTKLFAAYHAAGDVGCALGSLAAALVATVGYGPLWLAYSAVTGAGVLLYPALSAQVELTSKPKRLSRESFKRIGQFAGLSVLDSLGSGFLTATLIAYFFYKRFALSETDIGVLFLAADIANITSNFLAERIAARIGLVKTMVFTHLPASLLLVAMAFVPWFPAAAALFLLRELFIEMDVPTRQSYLASIVSREDRTTALGLVQLTRTAMWALSPGLAGWLMNAAALVSPLVMGSSLKISYDLLLLRTFSHLEPEDSSAGSDAERGGDSAAQA